MPEYDIRSCSYCPCNFATIFDLRKHMEKYGNDPREHLAKWLDEKHIPSTQVIDIVLEYLCKKEGS